MVKSMKAINGRERGNSDTVFTQKQNQFNMIIPFIDGRVKPSRSPIKKYKNSFIKLEKLPLK
jgi:hypothetical protein